MWNFKVFSMAPCNIFKEHVWYKSANHTNEVLIRTTKKSSKIECFIWYCMICPYKYIKHLMFILNMLTTLIHMIRWSIFFISQVTLFFLQNGVILWMIVFVHKLSSKTAHGLIWIQQGVEPQWCPVHKFLKISSWTWMQIQ